MSFSVYLESQKQAIANTVALQNAIKKQNPDSANKADFTDMRISIFSDQIKNEIRNKSAICNELSTQVSTAKGKNQNEVAKSISKVNSGISDLQSIIAWAGTSTSQLAGLSGLSDTAASAISENLGSAINFGASEIANSVSQANQALSQISVTENKPLETTIKSVQNNLNTAVSNTVTAKETTQTVIDTSTQKVNDPSVVNTENKAVTENIPTAQVNTDKGGTDKTDINAAKNTETPVTTETKADQKFLTITKKS